MTLPAPGCLAAICHAPPHLHACHAPDGTAAGASATGKITRHMPIPPAPIALGSSSLSRPIILSLQRCNDRLLEPMTATVWLAAHVRMVLLSAAIQYCMLATKTQPPACAPCGPSQVTGVQSLAMHNRAMQLGREPVRASSARGGPLAGHGRAGQEDARCHAPAMPCASTGGQWPRVKPHTPAAPAARHGTCLWPPCTAACARGNMLCP